MKERTKSMIKAIFITLPLFAVMIVIYLVAGLLQLLASVMIFIVVSIDRGEVMANYIETDYIKCAIILVEECVQMFSTILTSKYKDD